MAKQKSIAHLAKFLDYLLGRRPDEFGLVPDPDGFMKINDVLKALCEEDGLRHVRRSSLEEIRLTHPDPPFEITEKRIRAVSRAHLPVSKPAQNPPKLLYTCVRQKAHAHVLQKGLSPMASAQVILSSDHKMAERMGRRIDQQPVKLTVNVNAAQSRGVIFYQIGELLYGTDYIPADALTGPPLAKPKIEAPKDKKPTPKAAANLAGSFLLDLGNAKAANKGFWKKPAGAPHTSKRDQKRHKGKKPGKVPPPWRR